MNNIYGIYLRNREKKLLIKTLIFAFVFTYISMMVLIVKTYFKDPNFLKKTDVISFLTGAKIINKGDIKELYNTTIQLKYQNEILNVENRTFLLPFRNFPATAVFYTPLLNLSLRNSYAVVFCVNIVLLLIFHFIFTRYFPGVRKINCLLLLTIFIYPSIANLVAGQHTSVILLIISLIYLYTKKEESFISGIFTSLLAIKPQYLLFAPFSFVTAKNKKSFTAGFAVGILIFFLLNLVIAKNLQVFFDYPKFILNTENQDFGSRPYQLFTLFGLIKQVLPNVNSSIIIFTNFLIYLSILYFVYKNRINGRSDDVLVAGVFTTVLFSVHALSHDLMVFLLPIYILNLERIDKHLLYSGLIFIAVGILSLVPLNFITIFLIFTILFSRLRSLGSYRPNNLNR